eukprot:s169_g14.t1
MYPFAGQMHLCDFGASVKACPDASNCVGPSGTVYTPARLYSFPIWSTRVFVRDSMKAVFPEYAEKIDEQVDPGEYGLENYTCRLARAPAVGSCEAWKQHPIRKDEMSLMRNSAFAFFSGAYLGIGQHFVYNVAFTRLFGPGMELRVGVQKVLADLFVHVPFMYLPLYYMFEDTALGIGNPEAGTRSAGEDVGHDDDGDDDEEDDDDDDVDDDDDDGDGNHGPHHQTIFSINAEEITVIIISSIIVIFTITITIMSASGLRRWRTELSDTMMAYCKIFPLFHLFNFTVTPPELRIGLIACVSFVWLVVLSYLSHYNVEHAPAPE